MSHPFKNILLIGGGGDLGKHVLTALLTHPPFTITILTRHSSTSRFPPNPSLKIHPISDDYPPSELLSAFKNQDVVISCITTSQEGVQIRMIDATVAAEVKRFVPAEFGSNSADQRCMELVPLMRGKRDVVEYLRGKEATGLTWTSFVTGQFFDWGIESGFLGFDVQARRAKIWDDGTARWSATNFATVGLAVKNALLMSEKTANRYLFTASHTHSSNEVLAAFEKATGEKWDVTRINGEDKTRKAQELFAKGDENGGYTLILTSSFVSGYGNDFTAETKLDNELLGLPEERLEHSVDEVLKT
ncbi:hypothetical protein MMC30_004316 [Trapelia coarctata]|nr:hypothetical protein [Trapelia coarctata]